MADTVRIDDQIRFTLSEVLVAKANIKARARELEIDPLKMMLGDGSLVMTPLLVAESNLLLALSNLT